ncbi:baseplate assembly protein V [Vibrio phage 1.111.B._10N.286.45.E6]|nr:baseplate assembly protein V [Vibrio phage 1.111.A._10N.286.45.E6]AUR88276.1 baseplate assembly protein V [Vibrio phage 1.111.B._10N.286.45.E6]
MLNDSILKRLNAVERALNRKGVRGVVKEINPSMGAGGCVKVTFGDNQTSDWLEVKPLRSGSACLWWFPDVGEGVTVSDIDGGEVTPGSYTGSNPPPSRNPDEMVINFGDGGVVKHNRKTGVLDIKTNAKVNVTAPEINSTGSWNHYGPMIISETLEVQAELAVLSTSQLIGVASMSSGFVTGGASRSGAASIMNGTLKVNNGDVIVKGISSYSHTHLDFEGRPTKGPR